MLTQALFVIWLYSVSFCNGLPAEYCNHPFNGSDCGGSPTPVFAYYKPGSRCEIETWKGCPTLNKFQSEMTCSFFCIANLLKETSEENEISNEDSDSCEGPLNTEECNKGPLIVFTYDHNEGQCIKEKWRGCESNNRFSTREACENKCKAQVEKLFNNIKVAEEIVENLINDPDNIVEAETTTEAPVPDDADEADAI